MNNKILTFIVFAFFSTISQAQDFDGYKYIVVSKPDYGRLGKDKYKIGYNIANYFRKKKYEVIFGNDTELFPNELKFNPCLGLIVNINHPSSPPYEVTVNFINCKNESVKEITGKASASFENALNRIFNQLDKIETYSFNGELSPKFDFPTVENINKTEDELKSYFDSAKLDPIEGIYKSYKSKSSYKIAILKINDIYKAIIIESDFPHWQRGDVKSIFETTTVEGVYSAKFFLANKTSIETFANIEGGLFTVELKNSDGSDDNLIFLKLYPKKQ
jgi:hypothetical protein